MASETSCKNGGGQLAEHQTNDSLVPVIEAVNLAGPGEYWVGGKKTGDGSSYVWTSDNSTVDAELWAPGGYPLLKGSAIIHVHTSLKCSNLSIHQLIFFYLGTSSIDCIFQSHPDGYLRDDACSDRRSFVCQKDSKNIKRQCASHECGVIHRTRIMGGVETEEHEYPWQVRVSYLDM